MRDKTALYRHWDVDGNLLYVGISLSVLCRLAGHKGSAWFDEITSITIERFDTRAAAEAAERAAIQAELPIHNRAHSTTVKIKKPSGLVNYPEEAKTATGAKLERIREIYAERMAARKHMANLAT